MSNAILATDEARSALRRLNAATGGVRLHISNGCTDVRSPLCLPAGELRIGARDNHLGDIDGVAVYRMEQTDEVVAPCGRRYLLDIAAGPTVGFALEAAPGKRFMLSEIGDVAGGD